MKQGLVRSVTNEIRHAANRALSVALPTQEEIERFGADGEEEACRMLRASFDCVIRNAIVPHKDKFLEKDFLVIEQGVPFVIEIKNWKGTIGMNGDTFYQDKHNGVRKTLISPVGTTAQFVSCMKKYYGIERTVYGIVAFAEADCRLELPDSVSDIALMRADRLVSFIKQTVKHENSSLEPVIAERILRCTRFYSVDEEFCKGIVADEYLDLTDESGNEVLLDTTKISFITVESQPLRLRDKLYVTFENGASDVFYNRDQAITVACLDGTYRKIYINRIRHIVF